MRVNVPRALNTVRMSFRHAARRLTHIVSATKVEDSPLPAKKQTSCDSSLQCIQLNEKVMGDLYEVARSGNISEFEKLYYEDPSRLKIKDKHGQTTMHYAVYKSKTAILDFILSHGGDIDVQDSKGNSPLHLAVEEGQREAIEYLILHNANTMLLNKDNMTPLHLAVELNHQDILKQIDANAPGENGMGPLHLAACKNYVECAQILLHNKAKLCLKSDDGLYPVHIAAKHASSEVLRVLLDEAEKYGYTRKQVLSFMNNEDGTALHSAVNSGDLAAIRICIESGSDIDVQQDDKSTPVHLACAQGAMESIKTMFQLQPHKVRDIVWAKDVNGMTPLHKAALFDHHTIVKFLLDEGAFIDAEDKEERTALHLAASKRSIVTMCMLCDRGANIMLKDKYGRNFMHTAIKNGCKPSHLEAQVIDQKSKVDIQEVSRKLMNERDAFGCTPLHYASREGHFGSLQELIANGAHLNLKNNEKQSPLHFAAKYGRLNTCRRLLDTPGGANIINETDREGLTPLHVASQNGHSKVVSLLIQRGALLHRDIFGNTPLHLAAANGYTQTMRTLVAVHPHLVNVENNNKDTAIHNASREGKTSAVTQLMSLDAEFKYNKDNQHFFEVAIRNKHQDVSMAIITHARWREVMDLQSADGNPIYLLIQFLPDVCLAVLDRCKTHPKLNSKHKDFYYHYDFQYLQCPLSCATLYDSTKNCSFKPLHALNHMVKFNRVDCLSHPVSVQYLDMKWWAYGVWFHGLNLIQYLVFLILLTVSMVNNRSKPCVYSCLYHNNPNMTSTAHNLCDGKVTVMDRILFIVLSAFCSVNIVKEFLQMFQQKLRYFLDVINLIDWSLLITTGIYLVPGLFHLSGVICFNLQWEAGALAVFLAWFNLLLFMQRWEMFGIYIVMFLEILRTLLHVVVVFSIVIFAFGFAFYLLLANEANGAYSTAPLSVFTTIIMMLGEMNVRDSIIIPFVDNDPNNLHFSAMTFTLLTVFILFMPILLMNLLIGLAVGDIESVKSNARLKRLAMQVELHTELESNLPMRLLKWVDKTEIKTYPNCKGYLLSQTFQKVMKTDVKTPEEDHEESDSNQYMYEELLKQKQRVKDLASAMDKQTELLRLIVQKMEIKAENDEQDEGSTYTSPSLPSPLQQNQGRAWSSPNVRRAIMKHSTVSHWKQNMQ